MLELSTFAEQLFQGRDGAGGVPAGQPETGVQARQLTGGMGGDLALDAGGALESGIMDDHELMVSGQVQVQLHPPDAGLQRLAETGQGVFRGLPAGASMAVYQ